MSDTLGIDNNMMLLAFFTVINNIIYNLLFVIVIFFRKKNILGAVGNTAPQCQISGISSHNFDNADTLM